jgi:CDP-2,3-bis-(O-geranylgeranyl)-sn-glycerol synthase
MLIEAFLSALWFIGPAYAANAFPPLIKGSHPLDQNKNIGGKPVLGKGKTIEGTIAGLVFGLFIGAIFLYFQIDLYLLLLENNINLILLSPVSIILIVTGALGGDIFASFVKRRINIKRGASVPILDQLDFVAGAVLLSSIILDITIVMIFFMIILTPPVHYAANYIGYKAGVKRNPW